MAVSIALVTAVLATPCNRDSWAQGTDKSAQLPLVARGITDAPDGTVIVSGELVGGNLLIELRIKERQKVEKGEVIAVLSQYHRADSSLRMVEADLTKLKMTYETVLKGTRVAEVALQEATVKSAIQSNRLQDLQRARSPKPTDQKEIEATLAEQALEREKATLELMKTKLEADVAQAETDLTNAVARVDAARRTRDDALVRSPINGIVLQIFTRQGERIPPEGIAKIVDMRQLRVLADVDELSVGRVKPGGKVDLTFQGDNTVYKGTVERIAPTVKRMQRSDSASGTSADARAVQVSIMFDDLSSAPQVLGREARITFL
jgi:multidrug resistance efflux pump